MTLVITAGNADQFIQVSDRRLTVNGALQDDESNKAVLLHCANARLAFGFTGLARAAAFETRTWLVSTIHKCAPPDYAAQAILERVKEEATKAFQKLPISATQKRLTVMFSGYLDHHRPPLGGLAILTNYHDIDTGKVSSDAWPRFECYYREELRPVARPALTWAVGALPRRIDPKAMADLETLLRTRKPAKAIIGKLVDLFHRLAQLPESRGLIGKQLTSISVPRDPALPCNANYHSTRAGPETYMPDQIHAVSTRLHLTITNARLMTVDGGPVSGPKLRPNQPCWCQSGRKFKRCHGSGKQLQPWGFVVTPDQDDD